MPDIAALLAAALGRDLAADEPLAVAVSGGQDSVALLLLAKAAFPDRVTAITVDHGLRTTSAAEAIVVAEQCAAHGIPHVTLVWTGDKPSSNLQAMARAARYALMAEWCAANGVGVLLTAHHADDQAETLLMRLQRGSGAGLAGIRNRRSLSAHVMLVRPLLDVRSSVLKSVVTESGWRTVDDPSNCDPRFDRSNIRRRLAEAPWLDVPAIAASAAHLAEVDAALEWAVDRAWAGCVAVSDAGILLDVAGLPPELVRRLTLRVLAHLAPDAVPRGVKIMKMLEQLRAGDTATLAGVRVGGGAVWHFSRAPARRKQN